MLKTIHIAFLPNLVLFDAVVSEKNIKSGNTYDGQ